MGKAEDCSFEFGKGLNQAFINIPFSFDFEISAVKSERPYKEVETSSCTWVDPLSTGEGLLVAVVTNIETIRSQKAAVIQSEMAIGDTVARIVGRTFM